VRSYDLAPLTATAFSGDVVLGVVKTAVAVTGLGLQIAMPISASLFAANIVLGVISRSLPQLNIFMLSMPLNLLLGLLALIGSLAALIVMLGHLVGGTPQMMLNLLPHGA
jgi:flagellar biosynthetic protein FliR